VSLSPDTAVQFLKGVGEGRARALAAYGIETVRDLLWFFPYRYEDRRHPTRIAEVGRHVDEPVLLRGKVISAKSHVSPRRRMKIFEAVLEDGTGGVKLIWFNQAYLSDQIDRGDRLSVYGIPRRGTYGSLQIESPDWEKFEGDDEEQGAIVPIYSKVTNVPPRALRKIVAAAIEQALPDLDDPMPEDVRATLGVISLRDSIARLHRPDELAEDFLAQRSPAHLRVILQEFFSFQLALRVRRATEETKAKERKIVVDDALRAEVKKILPFRLTAAQKRVVREIADDLQSSRPMYRLLQGDVGSGKTIVALIAAMIAIRNGHQVALLAPTEILAEQHEQRIRQLVDHSVVMAKATGSMTAGERRTLIAGLRDGYIQLVVGTHAILEEKIKFQSLGLAIVDEQHRFGVEQRKALAAGRGPHVLHMTATPIPRTLALTIYGDLAVSEIAKPPASRKPIVTSHIGEERASEAYTRLTRLLREGRQAYVVCPLIEESETSRARAAEAEAERLQRAELREFRVGCVHGRQKAAERRATMAKFKAGELDVLVATTVIEVGVDVPNATVMIVQEADRFGLAQLHQLRGRVGRGAEQSFCVLVSRPTEELTESAQKRLDALVATTDGFELAEVDLDLRSTGQLLGTRQSGMSDLRFADFKRDRALLERARAIARLSPVPLELPG